MENGDISFFSPRQGKVIVNLKVYQKNTIELPLNFIQIQSYPGGKLQKLSILQNSVKIEIDAIRGLNIITFPSSSFLLEINNIE